MHNYKIPVILSVTGSIIVVAWDIHFVVDEFKFNGFLAACMLLQIKALYIYLPHVFIGSKKNRFKWLLLIPLFLTSATPAALQINKQLMSAPASEEVQKAPNITDILAQMEILEKKIKDIGEENYDAWTYKIALRELSKSIENTAQTTTLEAQRKNKEIEIRQTSMGMYEFIKTFYGFMVFVVLEIMNMVTALLAAFMHGNKPAVIDQPAVTIEKSRPVRPNDRVLA